MVDGIAYVPEDALESELGLGAWTVD